MSFEMIPSTLFTWDGVNKRVTAEASDLNEWVVPGESYINIKHYASGLSKRFQFNDNVYSGNGADRELVGWEYKCTEHGDIWILTVFND